MIDNLCRDIIKELNISSFVETGTDMGETVAEVAGWFSEMDQNFGKIYDYATTGERCYSPNSKPIQYPVFKDVGKSRFKLFSVDIDRHSFENAERLFKTNINIKLSHDNSASFLQKFINNNTFKSSETLFFLDAHWGKYWPLRDELTQILKLDKSVIVIDDFFVPKRSDRRRPHADFGFDFYYGRILGWGYVCDLFSKIDTRVYYPVYSNRYHRGFVLLFKGYDSKELDFLKNMPLENIDQNDLLHTNPVPVSFWIYLDFNYLIRNVIPLSLLRGTIRCFRNLIHRLFHK